MTWEKQSIKEGSMEPIFRLANETDIDLLIAFMRQFYAIDNYLFDDAAARAALTRLVLDSSLGRVWLIYREDEAIGYIALTFGYSLEFHGRDAFIDELFVLADQRQQGIGTKAMQFVIDACPDLGIHALHLEVEHTNIPGQKLYQKFGFEDHSRFLMTLWLEK
jgi:ribosomal protein S18 acetylase RimI-like enzyme